MSVELLQSFFGWCSVINVVLLTVWFLIVWLAHDFVYRMHGRMFRISAETFDAIHYSGLAAYKIGIFLLNLVPYLALNFAR